MNKHIRTVIIAPMTCPIENYSTQFTTTFQRKKEPVLLDQIRTADKSRLIKKLYSISSSAEEKVLNVL